MTVITCANQCSAGANEFMESHPSCLPCTMNNIQWEMLWKAGLQFLLVPIYIHSNFYLRFVLKSSLTLCRRWCQILVAFQSWCGQTGMWRPIMNPADNSWVVTLNFLNIGWRRQWKPLQSIPLKLTWIKQSGTYIVTAACGIIDAQTVLIGDTTLHSRRERLKSKSSGMMWQQVIFCLFQPEREASKVFGRRYQCQIDTLGFKQQDYEGTQTEKIHLCANGRSFDLDANLTTGCLK